MSSYDIACHMHSNWRVGSARSRDDLRCLFNKTHAISVGERYGDHAVEENVGKTRKQAVGRCSVCGLCHHVERCIFNHRKVRSHTEPNREDFKTAQGLLVMERLAGSSDENIGAGTMNG
ncbi:hypothetical protein TNCV_752151 [Trichonephila clavipes]|uniref:Uncharacterized protein n=1 Tax=Trichonephila clavipes TaxID=2585209 RepID=A0A8X6WA78_TRICX|nr:hypothetical protein TNCV_752151 [Trichonephila clavipes]